MLTGDVKKRLIEVLTQLVERHRRARAAVTDEVTDFCLFITVYNGTVSVESSLNRSVICENFNKRLNYLYNRFSRPVKQSNWELEIQKHCFSLEVSLVWKLRKDSSRL